MKLIIVESPTKARTLTAFLGSDYQVAASMGHVRDLPKKKLAIDVEKGFQPEYEVVASKKKTLQELKDLAKKAKLIILATDPDREGEAIAYHVQYLLHHSKAKIPNSRFSRIVFHEITRSAIQEALNHSGQVDLKLVESQQARRILDRLVGYKLSPLLWRKVRRGLSAGRVQSPALRLIVEKEEEIQAFKPEEYWVIKVEVQAEKKAKFWVQLVKKNGQPLVVKGKKTAGEVTADLKVADYQVTEVREKEIFVRTQPPFITSTLQQTAARVFHWSGKKTMRKAQQLYEKGLITYHRTDSTALAQEAILKIRDYIKKNFGEQYLPAKPKFYKKKSRMVQGAHEAIRPTKVSKKETKDLPRAAQRLYSLIWKKFVACQMNNGLDQQVKVGVSAKKGEFDYGLEAIERKLVFDGWRRLYLKADKKEKAFLPELNEGQELKFKDLESEQKFTQPPARFTEAILIKELEKKGIGRPSTYASIVTTIQSRKYVEKIEGRFKPTPIGQAVNQFLEKNFANIVDYEFTAKMEDDLDEVARGKTKWQPMIKEFYEPLAKKLEKVEKSKRVKIEVEKTGEKCPQCKKGDLVIRIGRFGRFISCSRFPDCDYKASYKETVKDVKCPDCGAEVVVKQTRRGKRFYGCGNYPKCKWASWRKPKP